MKARFTVACGRYDALWCMHGRDKCNYWATVCEDPCLRVLAVRGGSMNSPERTR